MCARESYNSDGREGVVLRDKDWSVSGRLEGSESRVILCKCEIARFWKTV